MKSATIEELEVEANIAGKNFITAIIGLLKVIRDDYDDLSEKELTIRLELVRDAIRTHSKSEFMSWRERLSQKIALEAKD